MEIVRNSFDLKSRLKDESIFNCANGKLGVRGNLEEGNPSDTISIRGTYINGFCEEEPINYNEKLFGFPESKQTIVNLPDAQGLQFFVEGKQVSCFTCEVKDYEYKLDMSKGLVTRSFVYDTGKGLIKFSFERFVSFKHDGLFTIKCLVESISYNGEILIKSLLNGDVKNFTVTDDPRVASGSGKMLKVNKADNISPVDNRMLQYVEVETNNSHQKCHTIVLTDIVKSGNCLPLSYEKEAYLLTASNTIDFNQNEKIDVFKYCYYDLNEAPIKQLLDVYNIGYKTLKDEQIAYIEAFFKSSRVLIDSKDIEQSHLDFCLYEMLCSAGKDGLTSIAAKGLSGEGYEGHYFWDCETYMYPFFLNSEPSIAKSLLTYRYTKLKEAKLHARSLGHKKGALYPWRTITGSECSSYYPSGSAQYHINGDIARAFEQYWNLTNDYSFLPEIAEVLLETARLWIDVGHYDDGVFKIDCVTGPDEYTCLVNNNYYTNAGAANNLYYAYKLINILKTTDKYEEFVKKTNLDEKELEEFKLASDKMYYPYDSNLGIIKQDDSFLNKAKVDLSDYPKEDFPLLLKYHPLYLYRHQVCKQADAVLADCLFGGLSNLDSMRTWEYYEKCTTHDSSLSKCIFAIVAAKLGDLSGAIEFFKQTLSTDLNDNKGNTRDGLHLANMGGCYLLLTMGFGGLKISENGISLFPMLPDGFNSYSFPIIYKNILINVFVDEKGTKLSIDANNINNDLQVEVYNQKITLNKTEVLITRKAKAVIFDLDGVITDTAIYHYQAWKKIADELGVKFDEKLNEQFKGVSRAKCLELLLGWGNIKVDEEEFNNLLVRKNNYYKDLLNNLTPDSILPGIIDTINLLHKNAYKISLFSVSKNTDAILARLGIADVFDELVTGNDIKLSKPNYEGYLLAADKMKVDPRLCIMVEDSVAGINGAKALSMKTIAIMKENVCSADICIENTSTLKDVVTSL